MSPQQLNQVISFAALALIVIVFVLVMTGTIPALAAIVVTLLVGFGVRFLRGMLIKP
jgi:hypothetical protein